MFVHITQHTCTHAHMLIITDMHTHAQTLRTQATSTIPPGNALTAARAAANAANLTNSTIVPSTVTSKRATLQDAPAAPAHQHEAFSV
jgi:hypothetical protein